MSKTLDLNFAGSKSLAGIGPTPSLARNSIGTHLDVSGDIQTAIANAARFHHDPASLASRGLLVEQSVKNWNTKPHGPYDSAPWSIFANLLAYGAGSVADATTAPDGTETADLIVPTTTSINQHYFRTTYVGLTPTPTTFTTSVFAKAGGYDTISMRNIGTDAPIPTYDLTALSHNTTDDHAAIVEYPNGWRRCLLSGNYVGLCYNYIYPKQQATFAGDGVSGVYFWGAMCEPGSVADVLNRTSFIPTDTDPVTREADVVTSTDLSWMGAANTIYTKFNSGWIGKTQHVWSIDDGSIANAIYAFIWTDGNLYFKVRSGGVEQASFAVAVARDTDYEMVAVVAANDVAFYLNGAQVGVVDTSASVPTVSRLGIGHDYADTNHLNSTIARIVGYNERLDHATALAMSSGTFPAGAGGGSTKGGPGLSFGSMGKLGA